MYPEYQTFTINIFVFSKVNELQSANQCENKNTYGWQNKKKWPLYLRLLKKSNGLFGNDAGVQKRKRFGQSWFSHIRKSCKN